MNFLTRSIGRAATTATATALLLAGFATGALPTAAPAAAAATCASSVTRGIAPPARVPTGLEGFHAAWYGQSGYMTLCPGAQSVATVAFYNSGSRGWVRGRMGEAAYLGTWGSTGQDQASVLGGTATGWPRANRIAVQPTGWVGPAQISWFKFTVQAPTTPGVYTLALRPLVEGAQWMEDYGVFWRVTVLTAEGALPPSGAMTINPGQLKSGPARTGSITVDAAHPLVGGSVDLRGGNITIRDDGVVDGVDIFNGTSSSGAVFIAGDRATIKNSVIRNSGDAGVLLNSDGSRGQKSATITDNAFRDLGDDAIHVKGTNRGDGQAPSYDMAQAGHYIARNSSTRTGTKDSSRSWSYEIQDGVQDMVMDDNWADNTYSIVGHTNLTFRRNTSIATSQPWGFEFGNMRASLWEGNVARSSGRFFEAIGFTGLNSESNVGNTLRGNALHHADNGLPLALGHNNNFYDNCYDDVSRWMYSKDQYNAGADVVSGQKACP